ncbi:hypothetical protein STEG23_013751 [Scotinomys teguina]
MSMELTVVTMAQCYAEDLELTSRSYGHGLLRRAGPFGALSFLSQEALGMPPLALVESQWNVQCDAFNLKRHKLTSLAKMEEHFTGGSQPS